MYAPRHFKENGVEVLHEPVRYHPLGTLVAVTPDGLASLIKATF